MFKDFSKFIRRGNVIDLAVAVIIGGAFGAIVTSIVDDIMMPIIGIIMGGINFENLFFQIGEAKVLYGNFILAMVNFLIIAFFLFLVVRGYNHLQDILQEEEEEKPQPPPEPSAEEVLLTEIRDLLKEQKQAG